MPTTQPLDDEVGDIAEGPLKSIAGFAQPGAQVTGQAPRAEVPRAMTTAPATAAKPAYQPQGNTQFRGNMRLNVRTPGVGLNGSVASQQAATYQTQPAAQQPAQTRLRENAYDDNAVLNAWERFISTNSAEHLLTQAMRVSSPRRLNGDTFRVAQSAVHLGYISENLGRITSYIRDIIGNDHITFTLEEVNQDSPEIWNDREFLQHIVEENPTTAQFIINLKLSLL